MEKITLTEELTSSILNTADASERLILGPQRNALEKVHNINSRYNLNLKITKTYRWGAGYMDQIKDYMANNYLEPHMKRKISTYFNQIDNKHWNYTNLRDQCNTLDNLLLDMRRRNQCFQNNDELIDRVWNKFIDIIKEQVDGQEAYYNVYMGNYTHINQYAYDRTQTSEPKDCVVFQFNLPETVCNYFVGSTSYEIPIYAASVIYILDLDDLLYKLSANLEWLEDSNRTIISSASYRYGHRGMSGQWKGSYHRKYINEDNNTRGYGQLLHPYIGSEEYDGSSYKIETVTKETYGLGHACLGDYQTNVQSLMNKLSLGEIYAILYNWHTVFNAGGTHPMNAPKQMFFGMHKGMDTDDFQALINTNSDNCRIASTSTSGPKTYCDDYECLNRDTCGYYNYDPDKAVVDQAENLLDDDSWMDPERFPETAQAIEDMNNGEPNEMLGDNIHDGEYNQTHTVDRDDEPEPANYDEEMDRINNLPIEDEPRPRLAAEINAEMNMEQQIIAWASQRGGAINIANNERNGNE